MPQFLTNYSLRFASQTRKIINSNRFFYATVLLFIVETTWIALTAVYPQAFDEQFHLGIIKIYAHQWSPFIAHQPAGADAFGAVARDPSYMYHYLLSFPYRLIAHFTNSLPTQVISMRFISVALMTWALFVYRRLLRSMPLSKGLAHMVLLFFVLIPVVPLLGAQINYDNLLIPLVGIVLLWTVQLLRGIQQKQALSLVLLVKLLALCLFTSLVMYSFLPVFAAVSGLFIYQMIHSKMFNRARLRASYKGLSRSRLVLPGLVLALTLGLFTAMYGVNLVRYHTPVPDCSVVVGNQSCLKYPPWGRDYALEQTHPKLTVGQVVTYPGYWLKETLQELTFAISSKFEPDGSTVDYYTANSLPVMVAISWIVTVVGAGLIIVYRKRIWQDQASRIFLVVTIVYVAVLFFQNFLLYRHTGQPLAIHGRYILQFIPLLVAIIVRCLVWFVQSQKRSFRQTLYVSQLWLVALGVVLMIQGSGFITYIVQGDPDWLWPQSSKAQKANHVVKKVLRPVVVGSKHPSE